LAKHYSFSPKKSSKKEISVLWKDAGYASLDAFNSSRKGVCLLQNLLDRIMFTVPIGVFLQIVSFHGSALSLICRKYHLQKQIQTQTTGCPNCYSIHYHCMN